MKTGSMFFGVVIHGDKRGRELGYRTANLEIEGKQVRCTPGVYAAYATLYKKKYPAALIVHPGKKKIEVHFFEYSGNECYGEMVSVDPLQKVSEIERYESVEELKEKIHHDINLVKRILKI